MKQNREPDHSTKCIFGHNIHNIPEPISYSPYYCMTLSY